MQNDNLMYVSVDRLLMKLKTMRAYIAFICGAIPILAIILSYLMPQHVTLFLGIQALLVALAYTIGGIFIEDKIKEEYNENVQVLSRDFKILQRKYKEISDENIKLKSKK